MIVVYKYCYYNLDANEEQKEHRERDKSGARIPVLFLLLDSSYGFRVFHDFLAVARTGWSSGAPLWHLQKPSSLISQIIARTTMETRPSRSIPRELSNFAHTSSFIPSLPNPSVAANNSFKSEHNQLVPRPYHLHSVNGGSVGHINSSDLYNSFIPETSDWIASSLPDIFDFPLDSPIQSNNQMEDGVIVASALIPSSLPDIFDFHLDSPILSNNQLEDGGIVASDEIHKQSDWPAVWDDHLITDEDPLMSTDLEDLLLDTSFNSAIEVQQPTAQLQFQQPQVLLQQPSPCVAMQPLVRTESSNSENNNNSSNSTNTAEAKGRIRWTRELHEAFVEAVNQLGGMDSATPKGVLKHMKVEYLTIYHVKSHLQKYRAARYIPEPSEGSPETKLTPLDQTTSLDTKRGLCINEALRIQMEVQKQLHQHLEIQRKLQLRIEEQGKALLMMFENQNMGFGKTEQEEKTSTKRADTSSEESDFSRPKRPRIDE